MRSRTKLVIVAALASILAVPVVLAQEASTPSWLSEGVMGKLPDRLEGLIERALTGNPDVLMADAKLRQAQAELNQARLAATRSVVMLHQERQRVLQAKTALAAELETAKLHVGAGRMPATEVRKIALTLAGADADLATIEAKLRYALGLGGTFLRFQTEAPARAPKSPGRPPLPESARAALARNMDVGFDAASLPEVLAALGKAAETLPFLLDPQIDPDLYQVTLKFPERFSVQNAMRAIVDHLGEDEIAFVFREYGVFVTTSNRAEVMRDATIPESVPVRGRR